MRPLAIVSGLALLFLVRLAGATGIPVLAYHDIVEQKNGDPYAITAADFARHMNYLAYAGYHPVSLHALEDARAGKDELPPKPVLLTFDDGYKSYHDIAFPILKAHDFPSVISLVTSWIDGRSAPDYTSAQFMSWDDLRALARSPLVEVMSHSDDLHHNVVANPYGARMPAAVTRLYDEDTDKYETEAAHRRRVRADLARSIGRIREELGQRPLGITWPYGSYDGAALGAADDLGLRFYLTLDDEPTQLKDLPRINRSTFRDYRALADLGDALTFKDYRRLQLRFVTFDLGLLEDRDPDEGERLILELERRVEVLRVNAVVLRPFTRDNEHAYFHTGAMPVAADVLSEIAYQLSDRGGLEHLILRVPASLDPAVYADLARLNWFSGIVIEKAPSVADFERVAALFRRFKPDIKIGVDAETSSAAGETDFRMIDLDPDMPAGALRKIAEEALPQSPRSLFLMHREPATSLDTLRTAMAVLRSAGAAHYGYGPDDYLHNVPPFLRVVRPLASYTIAAPPK
jgi:peptidoglycan/xylan/chitin deacetylase (PgdA/CDA1 family)